MLNELSAHYRIEREIGQGGMATVYLAHDLRHDRRVAIKVLRPDIGARIGAARFHAEIRTTATLQHPHILPLFDSGEAGDRLFYVMPLVEGESLRERLDRERTLSVDAALAIATDVADALDYAHAHGVVHRDIKPENVMLLGRHALVADFGIGLAARGAGNQRLTEANLVVGTPAYLSPEQASGDPTLDGRSDLYSLGCVLFEMLTGRLPFEGDSAASIIAKRFVARVPDPREFRPNLPGGVAAVVMKLLATSAEARYATGAEVVTALAAAPDASAPTAHTDPSIVVVPFAHLSPEPDTEYFSDGMTDEIISTLARVPGLRVMARTTSYSLKGSSENLQAVARRLNVATVLEGSVRRQQNRVRITVELTDALQGKQVWSERYERNLSDVFAVQEEIATAIAARLSIQLGASRPRAERPPSHSMEAYELYLRGRHFVQQRGGAMADAIANFRESIRLDPEYSLPYAGLAEAYTVLALYDIVAPAEALVRGLTAAERAVALDPDSSEAHRALGLVELYLGWHLDRSESSLRHAVELAPEQATSHAWLAMMLAFTNRRDEARVEARIAVELEPHSPLTVILAGNAVGAAGDPHAALDLIDRGLALSPELVAGHYLRGMMLLMLSRPEDAVVSFGRGIELVDCVMLRALRGLSLLWSGRGDEAREIAAALTERVERTQRGFAPFAGLLWNLGEHDRAFAAMQRAFDDHAVVVWSYPIWVPGMAGFAEDPRWGKLLASSGLSSLWRKGVTA